MTKLMNTNFLVGLGAPTQKANNFGQRRSPQHSFGWSNNLVPSLEITFRFGRLLFIVKHRVKRPLTVVFLLGFMVGIAQGRSTPTHSEITEFKPGCLMTTSFESQTHSLPAEPTTCCFPFSKILHVAVSEKEETGATPNALLKLLLGAVTDNFNLLGSEEDASQPKNYSFFVCGLSR